MIDDYGSTFGIGRHSAIESLIFYLLDDDKEAALKVYRFPYHFTEESS